MKNGRWPLLIRLPWLPWRRRGSHLCWRRCCPPRAYVRRRRPGPCWRVGRRPGGPAGSEGYGTGGRPGQAGSGAGRDHRSLRGLRCGWHHRHLPADRFPPTEGRAVIPYIPDRLEEGYGLNREAVTALKEQGASLIVTVDCGITALEETAWARSLGIDVVITDHHECKSGLPAAQAVVDPGAATAPAPARAWPA